MTTSSRFLSSLADSESIVFVSVHSTRGSVPRAAGAWMLVSAQSVWGTVGGGRLEWDAIAHARELLAARTPSVAASAAPPAQADVHLQLYRLGPSLGQCCGGEVQLEFACCNAAQAQAQAKRLSVPEPPLALFGGGHVGHALVQVLSTLDTPITWIDSRDEVFPQGVQDTVQCEHSDPVQAAVPTLASGSRVLIMSFSHAEDLDIVAACLLRQRAQQDLPYIGLIGSQTKWAAFRARLRARGFLDDELNHVTCPIGMPGIDDKRPQAIAIAVAAQLLLLQKQ